jgi:hypothetical protein
VFGHPNVCSIDVKVSYNKTIPTVEDRSLLLARPVTPLQRRLWIDLDAPPVSLRLMPRSVLAFRDHLRASFDPGCALPILFADRTHDHGQQLLPLLRRVSYTQALIDGAFRLLIEYRPCDKFPHYRLMWGSVLWGRVDIRMGNQAYGSDFLSCPALPFVQARLADYLVALGLSVDAARLRTRSAETVDDDESDALVKTDTREYRMFKVDIEQERRQARKTQATTTAYVLPRAAPVGWWTLADWGGSWPRWISAQRI